MKNSKGLLLAGAALAGLAGLPGTVRAEVKTYSDVTEQRLQNPEPRNWLMYRGTYDGQGYSPLDKINTSNVADLVPVWTLSTGVLEGHQSPPIVNDGVMFVTTPQAQVIALDAKTGEQLWRYKRELPDDLTQLHPTNRGVALLGDRVYVATVDDFLVALDAKTGKEVWAKEVEDYRRGHYMTLAPLVAHGKVMVGGSGGEFGVRGFVAAYDAKTGEQAWRTYTVPARRTRQRHLDRRHLEDRRRLHLDHRHLRPEGGHGLLGHRQRGAVDGQRAARRQPEHLLRAGARRGHRGDQVGAPVPLER